MALNDKSVLFIDNSDSDFTGFDLNTTKVRGTESSLILLAESLVKNNIYVKVLTEIEKDVLCNGVIYCNKSAHQEINFDLCIAISNANLFNKISAKKKVVWSNSLQPFEKFLRKKQLLAFLKHKPEVVTMCNYQYYKRSFLTSMYGKHMISLSVDPRFYNEKVDLEKIPKPYALNNVRSHRNLDWLIDIWTNSFNNKNGKAKLFINPNLIEYSEVMKKSNIYERKFGSRDDLINELRNTRVFAYTGHKSDIWVLTVEEAVQMCVPIVTYGIGSVEDRVIHNETGFIAKNDEEFSKYLEMLLFDDEFYNKIRRKMFKRRGFKNWDFIADIWIKKFLS
ncbi:MAG: glycosyltransferase [Candidatus Pelagibacterales bacterium]